jgi:hypothetical protein
MSWRIQSTVVLSKDPDWNYGLFITALQSHLEIWLGIIAANLPTLAPLLSRLIAPAIRSYFKGQSSTGRRKILTFGTPENSVKRDEFDRLQSDSVDCSVELLETQYLNMVEVGPPTRSVSPYTIALRHDVEVYVESAAASRAI